MAESKHKGKILRFSIRSKLILVNTAFIFLALGVSTLFEAHYLISFHKKKVLESVFVYEDYLRKVLEDKISSGMKLDAIKGIDSECAKVVKSTPYGTYCFVTDTDGRVYYSSDKRAKGRVYDDGVTQRAIRTVAAKEKFIQYRRMEPGNYMYDLSVPVYDYDHRLTGVIRAGVSPYISSEEIGWTINRFLIIGLFFTIFVVAGISLFDRILITNPVNHIINGLRKFSRGELDYRIKYKRSDEFGQLAASLNEVAEKIAVYQKELIFSRQYASSIIENIVDSLIVTDKELVIENVNNATLGLLGYEDSELIGRNIKSIIKDNVFNNERIGELLKNGYIKDVSAEYIRKDGTAIPFSLSASFIRIKNQDSREDNFKIIIIARDMREMKGLIRRLEHTNAKFQESSLILEKRVRERTNELERSRDAVLNILEDLQQAKDDIETDRKNFVDIVEKSAESIIVVDRKGKIMFVNEALCSLFESPREELKGQSLGLPIIEEEVIEVDILPSGGKELKKAEMKVVETEWFGENAYLLLLHDITERIKFTEALKRAAQEWRVTFDTIADMVFLLDKEGRILRSNATAEKILGLPFNDIKGKLLHNILNPDIQFDHSVFIRVKEIHARYARVIRKGDKWFSIIVDPIIDENGSFNGAACIVSDITKEEKVRRELRSTKYFVENIVESARSVIHVIDKDGIVISINRFAEELLGYKREDIIGKNWFDNFVSEQDRKAVREEYLECIKGKKVEGYESGIVGRDNKEYVISWYVSALQDSEGETIGTVALGYDVTDRKEVEKSQRLAQLGKLVADMAHEVNNPLMVISGRAQLSLMEDIQNEEIKKNFNIIIKECHKAKDIIQRLLKFSRPSKGEVVDININTSLDEIISLIEHQFFLSNVQIRKDYGQNIPAIRADSKQLQEVFMNLFNNARDAMPSGGVINVKTYYYDKYVNVEFKDSGIGMDKNTLNRAFDPFFTTKEKGTGLGLAMCYSIIKKQGGDMRFESAVGKGTTAIIKLLPKEGNNA